MPTIPSPSPSFFYKFRLHVQADWKRLSFFLLCFAILIWVYAIQPPESVASRLWGIIDPASGILSLFVTLVILYNQRLQKWEDGLEKRLTIDYFTPSGKHVLHIGEAYLSGPDDIRAWAQNLGGQVLGSLSLDMNWDDSPPLLEVRHGQYFKHYQIKMHLREELRPEAQNKMREFLSASPDANFRHSSVTGDLQNLPVKWVRIDDPTRQSKPRQDSVAHDAKDDK